MLGAPHAPRTVTALLSRAAHALPRWERFLARLEADGAAILPVWSGVPIDVWERAAWRAWLETRRWGPLVRVPPGALPDDVIARASGGWLVVGPGWRAQGEATQWFQTLRRPRTGIVLVDDTPGPALPPDVASELQALDAHHLVASDPTLVRVRAVVAAQVAMGGLVHVAGPRGSGRGELVAWAHATFGGGRCEVVEAGRTGGDSSAPWLLVRDVEDLDRSATAILSARLPRRGAPMPATASAPAPARPDHPAFAELIGSDPAFRALLAAADRHATGRHAVLVLGESGAGKEPLARAIHARSGRRGPFVVVDAASRASTLVEDDLFGHVPGAFEGARTPREGAFRRAHQGTLFLDEAGNLSLALQAKLLRALETGEVQPLGSDQVHRAEVRIVAATNADLERMVSEGTFRLDLLQRLRAAVLRIPPLRERPGDIAALALHLLRRTRPGHPGLADDAVAALQARDWPGNVRELAQAMEVAAAEAGGARIEARHLAEDGPRLTFVTSGGDLSAAPGLTRAQREELDIVTLRVEGPASRGPVCVRHVAEHVLAGRIVRSDAMDILERWPWWGHLPELQRRLRLLATATSGTIDAERVRAVFPEMAGPPSAEPILAVLDAWSDGDEVSGLRADFRSPAVLIGRARRLQDLDEARRSWVLRHTDGAAPGFLAFPHLPDLSRAHVIVVRTDAGLVAHRVPGAQHEVLAGPAGNPLQPVEEPVLLGDAGHIRVRSGSQPLMDLHVFRGERAMREAAPRVAVRNAPPQITRALAPARMGTLEEEDVALLNAALIQALEGPDDFASHMRKTLGADPDPRAARLWSWMEKHPSQYVSRLFHSPTNAHLRDDLARRLAGGERRELARSRLPKNLIAALGDGDG